MRCSKSCSARRFAISGKARILSAASLSTGAPSRKRSKDTDAITIGGSGFGVMALLVAAQRGWVSRAAALERLARMLELLARARCYHGSVSALHGRRHGQGDPFGRKDDGGDLVETSLLMMGLLAAREYFNRDAPAEAAARSRISDLWNDVEWNWFTQAGATFSIGIGARTTAGR
jgi:hypothetical protein